MSLGILALKIGLAAGAAGASVVIPILLKRNRTASSTVITQTHSETTVQRPETTSDQEHSLEENTRGGGRTHSDNHTPELHQRTADGFDVSHNQVTAPSLQATILSFDKTCFEVPATFDGDGNMQLLTCFDTEKLKNAHKEGKAPEFDSIFHLFDKNKKDNPVKIEGKMEWSFESRKISFYLNSNSEGTKYTFTADKSKWGDFLEGVSDLKEECAIFQVTSKDSVDKKEYWLACSEDTEEFEADKPKGIKLTSWTRQ